MRITAASIIVLVCALAAVGLFANRAADAGQGCPSDWPAPQSAASQSGHGSIDYNDFHTDGDGDRWFIIRSTDSNGYTSIRAYVADDGYDSGYRSSSPDETCYLIVRRSGDTADVADPTPIVFQVESERENLPFVDDLFASLSTSEISCIRNIIGKTQTLQRASLMDTSNTLPVYRCIAGSKMYDNATITFLVKLFAIQDGGRSYQTVNCLTDVSKQYPKLIHLRLGTVSMGSLSQDEQRALGLASNEMTECMTLHEQILNLRNIVVAQDALDNVSNGNYIISAINASTDPALNNCIDSNNVRSRLEEIRSKTVIESFKRFENGELLNCLLLDQQTSAEVYAHIASSRAGISSPPTYRLSPQTEACFENLADASSYRLLLSLAVDPQGVVDHSATITANDAVLNSLVLRGFACMTPGPNDPPDLQFIKFQDLQTAFVSSNLALQPPR